MGTGIVRRRIGSAMVVVALAAGVAGCGGSGATTAPPTGSGSGSGPGDTSGAGSSSVPGSPGPMPTVAPGAACLTPAERTRTLRFTSGNGASIAGVLLGSGKVALVLAHQVNGDLCEWVPYGRVLASRGYGVLAVDLNGFGASQASAGVPAQPRYDQDLLAAAAVLRSRGAARVILVGATLGGLAAVVAAAQAHPPVAAVVDVSGPAELSGLDAVAAARRLTVPVLCLTSEHDEFVQDVRTVAAAAAGAPEHPLVVIPGTASHGIALLDPTVEPKAAQARATIEAFLRAHAS